MPRIGQFVQQVPAPMAPAGNPQFQALQQLQVPRLPSFYSNPFAYFTERELIYRALPLVPIAEGMALVYNYQLLLCINTRFLVLLTSLSYDSFKEGSIEKMLQPASYSSCINRLAGFTSLQELFHLSGLEGFFVLAGRVLSTAYNTFSSYLNCMSFDAFANTNIDYSFSAEFFKLGFEREFQPFDLDRCPIVVLGWSEPMKMLALGLCFYQAWIYSRNNPTLNQMVGGRGTLLKSALATYFLVVLSDAALIALRE